MIAIHVVDGLIIGQSEKEIDKALASLANEFEIKFESPKNNTLF